MVAVAFIVLVAVLIVVLRRSSGPTIGYDVSYPQCSSSYPSNPLFGIVGVNGGLADNANRCVGDEVRWASNSPGQKRPRQRPLSLYINTGNPGGEHVADWPGGGTTPAYGSCNGLLTNACSYLYGEQRAAHSYRLLAPLDSGAARTAPWWLDVELTTSWAGTYQLNRAALHGFIAGLRNAGAIGPIGIYSTGAQWRDITGPTAQSTPTAFNGPLPAFHRAVTQLERAEWLTGQGRSEQARTLVAEARETFEQLDARPWLQRVDVLWAEALERPLPDRVPVG